MSEYRCSIPILMIGFNRPDNIHQVFEKVREARPYKLYIAIDGARKEKEGEDELVKATKKIVANVDWDCEVHRKYNEKNLGAEVTISSALRWICETEEYFIMLEDDIVAPLSFFKFQEEMLIKYKDVENIKLVSGINFTPLPTPNGEDYFFTRYGYTGGWGSWRRVWKDFDLNTEVKAEHCTIRFCKTISCCKEAAKRKAAHFKRLRKRGVGNIEWDNLSSYVCDVKGMFCIVPRVNLSTNIGVNGLHDNQQRRHHFIYADSDFKVVKHPTEVKIWEEYELYHFNEYVPKTPSFPIRLLNFIKRKSKAIFKK